MPSDDFWAGLPERTGPSLRRRTLQLKPLDAPDESPKKAISKQVVKKSVGATEPTTGPVSLPATNLPLKPRRWFPIIFTTVVLMVLGTGIGLGLFVWYGIGSQADPTMTQTQLVEIMPGQSRQTIAASLESQGLILSQWPFLAYVVVGQINLQAGTYALSPSFTTREIAEIVGSGKTAAQRITIQEGWRIEQIADYLAELGLVARDEFLARAVYDPAVYQLPPGIQLPAGASLEGLLFPDTYQITLAASAQEIVQELITNFTERTQDRGLTYQDIILASIVEREAKFDTDRAAIAGVYENRLVTNMRLQADPTVQYAKDTQNHAADPTSGWWAPITVADYQAVDSPFNTYLVQGLPSQPISNPGLKSLEAAQAPTDHDFYFFLNRTDGTTIFSKSKDEHDRAKLTLDS